MSDKSLSELIDVNLVCRFDNWDKSIDSESILDI
jgi:hypothetical protein